MIQDFRSPPDGAGLEADVCVIGSGAAGITVARRLAASKLRTVVVESGGLDFDPEIQSLTAASVAGLPMRAFDPARLETVHAGRFRIFGGTTYAWAGICTELDESDFETREWVPYSGWPFAKTDLDPWYRQAQREIGVDPELLGDQALIKLGIQTPHGLDLLRVHAWQFCAPPFRFGFVHRAELAAARNTLVLLHATATKLHANAARTAVERVEVRARDGRSALLRARAFVLAGGGVENARLLLASTDGRSPGLGNDRDLVGRFFMDHLRATSAC